MKDEDYKKVNNPNKKCNSFKIIKTVKPDIYELYLYNEQKTSFQKHKVTSKLTIKFKLNNYAILFCSIIAYLYTFLI